MLLCSCDSKHTFFPLNLSASAYLCIFHPKVSVKLYSTGVFGILCYVPLQDITILDIIIIWTSFEYHLS